MTSVRRWVYLPRRYSIPVRLYALISLAGLTHIELKNYTSAIALAPFQSIKPASVASFPAPRQHEGTNVVTKGELDLGVNQDEQVRTSTTDEPLTQVRQGKQDGIDQTTKNKQNEIRKPEGTPAALRGETGGESMAHMSLYSNSNADKVATGNYEDIIKTDSKEKKQETKLETKSKEKETDKRKGTKETRRHEEGKMNEVIDVLNNTREESMRTKAEVKQTRKEVAMKTGITEVKEEVKKGRMETDGKNNRIDGNTQRRDNDNGTRNKENKRSPEQGQ